jgi:glycosyltransferase involved in cell wall biosynthesis
MEGGDMTDGELPRISIVTPSYNQAEFLERTIRSVLDQGYPDLEYLVIDGGSTDGSVDIIRKYEDQIDYWVSEPDRGQTHALNKGFKRATGDVCAWLNSDDMYCPGILMTMGRAFAEDPSLDVVFGNMLDVDQQDRVTRDNRSVPFSWRALILCGAVIHQSATFWKRELFEKHGWLDEELTCSMDYELFCRITRNAKTKFIRRPVAYFRRYPEQKTSALSQQGAREHAAVAERYIEDACGGWPPWLVRLACNVRQFFWHLAQGEFWYAIRGTCGRVARACLGRRPAGRPVDPGPTED